MGAEFQRSLGLELGGSRADRTALAVLDYSERTHRLILVEIDAQNGGIDDISPDEMLLENISSFRRESSHLSGLAVHAPTSLPPFFDPEHPRKSEAAWMERQREKIRPRPKPFLAYLQRPAEVWLRYFTPEKFQISDGLGANVAPLAARFRFLYDRMPKPTIEVYPRATMSRIVSSLGMPKHVYRSYTDLEKGLESREHFFDLLLKELPQIFVYEKDLELMILHLNCFHAFLAALTQHIVARGQDEAKPRGFPRDATWIHLPRADIDWDVVF